MGWLKTFAQHCNAVFVHFNNCIYAKKKSHNFLFQYKFIKAKNLESCKYLYASLMSGCRLQNFVVGVFSSAILLHSPSLQAGVNLSRNNTHTHPLMWADTSRATFSVSHCVVTTATPAGQPHHQVSSFVPQWYAVSHFVALALNYTYYVSCFGNGVTHHQNCPASQKKRNYTLLYQCNN